MAGIKERALKLSMVWSLVSWRQITVGVVCGMASRTLLHLLLSPSPLTFQESMVIDLAIGEQTHHQIQGNKARKAGEENKRAMTHEGIMLQ